MLRRVQQTITRAACNHKAVVATPHLRWYSQESTTSQNTQTFDEKTLEHLVCPLSKKDLRYDKEKNELVCDEIGVAYPIINGIPNLVPQDARVLKSTNSNTEST